MSDALDRLQQAIQSFKDAPPEGTYIAYLEPSAYERSKKDGQVYDNIRVVVPGKGSLTVDEYEAAKSVKAYLAPLADKAIRNEIAKRNSLND